MEKSFQVRFPELTWRGASLTPLTWGFRTGCLTSNRVTVLLRLLSFYNIFYWKITCCSSRLLTGCYSYIVKLQICNKIVKILPSRVLPWGLCLWQVHGLTQLYIFERITLKICFKNSDYINSIGRMILFICP